MRARALLALTGTLIAAVVLVSASGAATTKAQKVTRIDVSTRLAVIHYLRSIHVSPKGAVIERGGLNYAGAHCPGKAWTCASTRHTVVQIAKRGGVNRYFCRSSKCVVVQLSGVSRGVYIAGRQLASTNALLPTQTATCIKTTGLGQSCSITQVSSTKNNKAVVYESAPKSSGLTQSATSTATITQQATGSATSPNFNEACVLQQVSMDGSTVAKKGTPVTVTLQAHESIIIRQDSSHGTNRADESATQTGGCTGSAVTQNQTLTSTATGAGPITQNEDATYSPCGDTAVGGLPGGKTDYANLCLDIEQNMAGANGNATGTNDAVFTQNSTQAAVANTPAGPVNQTQSTPLCSTQTAPTNAPADCAFPGGLVGTVNQYSSGISTATPTQNEYQCEDAAPAGLSVNANCLPTPPATPSPPDATGISGTVNQTQYGPVGVANFRPHHKGRVLFQHGKGLGQATQTGNSGDIYQITQNSTQNADNGAMQLNLATADCITPGTCKPTQITTLDGSTTQDGYEASSIQNLAITCPGNGSCKGTPPPDPINVSGPASNPNPSSSAAFHFEDAATGGIHFLCKIDGGTVNEVIDNCASDTAFFQGYGPHTFQVAASDNHGNVSHYVPATAISWTNVPPDPTITDSSKPTNPDFFGTSDTFAFTDADTSVHFHCTLDGNEMPCNSGSINYTSADLAPGEHTFSVQAFDTTDTYGSLNSATYTWKILALSVSALGTDGSFAGWACQPGGPIALTLGTDTGNTFGAITITDANGTALDGLAEPTFTTDNYAAGSPRYYITLDNGDSLWGYPPNSGLNGTDFAWAINNGNTYQSWSDVVLAESGATVTGAFVIADGDQDPGVTDSIGDLTFNGTDFNPDPAASTCP